MESNITVREWIDRFNRGEYESKDFKTQCDAGWYDWFCKNESLAGRLKKIGNIIKDITNDFILDNYYVWFKNNCPFVGKLYDDFRFEPINYMVEERDKLYFGVSCDDKRSKHKYQIFTGRKGYETEFIADKKPELIEIINLLGEELRQNANQNNVNKI